MRKHLFGVHWVPLHRAGTDKATFAAWNPPFVKLVWDGSQPPYLEDIPPDAKIVWRNYPLSEAFHGGLDTGEKAPFGSTMRETLLESMASDGNLPQNGSGRDGAQAARALLAVEAATPAARPTPEEAAAVYLKNAEEVIVYCESKGVPRRRLIFEGPNEYPVWAHGYDGLARLELARLRGLHKLGVGGCYGNLGVGWPGNSGPDTPPVWDWFARVAGEFGPDDYLGAHEYWGKNGVKENWGWWAGRIFKCPYRVKLLITECGIDLGVYGPSSAKQGWLNCWPNASLDEKARNYIGESGQYEDAARSDGRAAGLLQYTFDGNRDDWGMFSLDLEAFLKQWLPWLAARPPLPDAPATPGTPTLPTTPTTGDAVWRAVKAAFGAQAADARAKLKTNGSYVKRNVSAIQRIVVHHSAAKPSVSWAAIARYHVDSKGWPGIGYHFGITPDGGLTYVGDAGDVRYHAGNANADSVGVCFAGDYRETEPTAASVATFAKLRATLEAVLGRSLAVVGHMDVMETACPGERLYAAVVRGVASALLAAAASNDLMTANPEAALLKAILAAGALPVWGEYRVTVGETTYVCQTARKPGGGRLVFYCADGQWENVRQVA